MTRNDTPRWGTIPLYPDAGRCFSSFLVTLRSEEKHLGTDQRGQMARSGTGRFVANLAAPARFCCFYSRIAADCARRRIFDELSKKVVRICARIDVICPVEVLYCVVVDLLWVLGMMPGILADAGEGRSVGTLTNLTPTSHPIFHDAMR